MRKELQKLCGNFELGVTFEPDDITLQTFSHFDNLISVLCTLRKEGVIVGQGRGWSTFNRMNKSLERCVYAAINGSLLSAVNNGCKIWDNLRLNAADKEQTSENATYAEAYRSRHDVSSERATDKQKAYARQLLSLNVEDEADREQIAGTLDDMTKDEISSLIQRFAR